jgi:hypothetical protein
MEISAITMVGAVARRLAGRPEMDMDIVRRLSALDESHVLAYFWVIAEKATDRLDVLLHLSHVVIVRPPAWDREAIRRAHEHGGGAGLDRSMCFACGEMHRPLYFHHVIEVQNGGSNAARNQVPLCFACHQFLHPWLKDEPAPDKVDGLESLGSIINRTIRLHSR